MFLDTCSFLPNTREQIQQVPIETLSVTQALQKESRLLEEIAIGIRHSATYLWQTQEKCLVIPRLLTRNKGFVAARTYVSQQGWNVCIRSTGGGICPQLPGVINLTKVYYSKEEKSIRSAYLALCQPFIDVLQQYNIRATTSSVQGSFCDGEFNIVVDGKKLSGTAQRWKKTKCIQSSFRSEFGILSHALVLIDADMDEAFEMMNIFHQYCDLSPIDPNNHVLLKDLLLEVSCKISPPSVLCNILNKVALT